MEQWIEQCTKYYGKLTWEGVSKMIKTMHLHREEYPELMQREIDLTCSLKDKKESIFTLVIFLLFYIVSKYFSCLCLLIYLFTKLGMMQLIHHKAMC